MRTIRLLPLGLLLAAQVCWAQEEAEFTQPGWFRSTERAKSQQKSIGRAASPAFGGAQEGFGTMSLVTAPEIAEAITPEIEALARGLENDPKQIFDYVHDHIHYVHYFGSKKGAQLTLLERSGNDFDQCALLVALLRAAGHTANYYFGLVYMPYESPGDDRDFKHWLGLTKPGTNLSEVLNFALNLNDFRGFPDSFSFADGSDNIALHRVWVRLDWANTTFWLDPAFKINQPIDGINLATAMGLDTNQLMSAAGGTSTANYVQSLSEVNLRNKLRDYTTNLLGHLQSNYPNASLDEILGGQYIVSSVGDALNQDIDTLPFGLLTTAYTNWAYLPTNLMTTLNVKVDNTNTLLWMPQLQGQKLALTFSTGGQAQLWLEDDLLLEKQTSGGGTVEVVLSVDHPHGTWNWTNNTLINTNWDDQAVTKSYQRTNASYAITYAFDPDQEWLRQRQDRLDRYRQEGFSDTSREVITETLNVMGLNWMLQTERIPRVLVAQQDMLLQHHHRLGRMAQESGKGYYIDIYAQLSGIHPANGNSTNDIARSDRIYDLDSYFASAAEHALIEQLQSSNLVAASTIKMLQIGNTNGQRTYQAKSSNWSSIQASLSNYDKNWLKTNYIDKGYTLLLPANGSNLVAGAGGWAGYGIVARGMITNGQNFYKVMDTLIDGGYHGGYVSQPTAVVDTPYVYQSSYAQPLYFDPVPTLVATPFGADPVNMADGSFEMGTTDLSLGQAEPRGITFTRYYSSSRRRHNLAGMAHGWIHNYYLKATEVSAPLAALGDSTPAQTASLIVATRSAVELYNTSGNPKNWAVTALIAKWGLDQLINNAVSVTLGDATLQFVRQPDGTFTPPAKSTMTLLKNNGVYWLQERHGNTFKFNVAGWLTNIVDQYNQSLTLTYDSSNRVTQAKDWKNRTLAFTYSGTPQRLASVADSTGRTVNYGYTTTGGQLDLTSVTDPESKTSTFLYDTNHQITVTKDALNRIVVSNAYDGFGRVIEQCSKGDTNQTWQLFWSGFLNTEKDPAGGRKQYRYDDKHRLIQARDALGHFTYTGYDGQNHVVQAISHLLAWTDYYFDGRHNLIAVNDPLGYWKSFYYDAQDNLVRIWDERGNNSYFGYNPKFQLTGSTNGAGDWTTFVYDGTDGTLTSRSVPGGTTSYGYDSYGQLSSVTHPASLGGESYQNNARGDVTSRTNPRGFTTTFQYSNRRELTNTLAPTNLTTGISMDAVGNIQSTTDPRGFTTSNSWSATRKLLATTLPATPQGTPVMTNLYDARDWLWRSLNPLQQATTYTNDQAQRLINVTDPLARTSTFAYDNDNRKVYTANAAGEATWDFWNERNELTFTITPQSTYIDRVYDGAGNQTALTNRNRKSWRFQFDAANRLTNTISPLNRQTKQVWNNRGLLQTVIEPSTETTSLYYDARDRLTNRTDSVGSVFYRYDANNNRTAVSEETKTNTWGYDAYDRVTAFTNQEGYVIQYRSDGNGNVTNLVYPGNRNVFYFFDSLNRLTNVTDWANRKTSIEYDLASHVRKITRPNGTVREVNYDAAGQTTSLWEKTAAGVPIAMFKLNWNSAARVEWEYAAPPPHACSPPTRVMTYNDDNQIATFNSTNVSHDADGNMTYGPGTNNTFGSYTYDARNRLTGAGGVSYGYDALGNRTSITNGTNITRFVVNPNAALTQVLIRIKPGVTNYYIHGLGLLYEITETAASTSTATYHYDYRGSTVAITDGNGSITDRIEYSAYGSSTYRAGTNSTPFLYNGRYGVQTDPNGLLHMRARYYNPYLCRFLNADPAGFSGGLNFYAYADGNPVSMIDPFGLNAGDSSFFSWVDRGLDSLLNTSFSQGIANGVGDHMDRFDALMYQTSGTPDWLGPVNTASAMVNLAAQDVGMLLNDLNRGVDSMLGQGTGEALATMPMLAWEGQLMRLGGATRTGASSAAQGALLRQQLAAEEILGSRMPQSLSGYTTHGLNQAISREGVGVSPSAILDTWRNPTSIRGVMDQYGGSFRLGGQNATIAINPQGQITTMWPNSSAGFRIHP